MDTLIELTKVVTKKRLKKIELFNGSASSKKSKYYKLYDGVRRGIYKNDYQAAKSVLKTVPSDKKYLMLKSRVIDRLITTLFFFNFHASHSSGYYKALCKCERNLVSANFLLYNGLRKFAIKLIRGTLHDAKALHFTKTTLECLWNLRYNASLNGKIKEFEKLDKEMDVAFQTLEAEYESDKYWHLLQARFMRNNAVKPELVRHALEYADKTNIYRKRYKTHTLNINYYRIKGLAHYMGFQFSKAIYTYSLAEKYLQSNPKYSERFKKAEFALYKLVSYINQRDYKNGLEYALKCQNLFPKGSNNWLVFLEYYYLILMQSKNYKRAAKVFEDATNHPKFNTILVQRIEKWEVFGAYLQYVKESNISPDLKYRQKRFLALSTFLKEVPIYTHDKEGLYISILIVQFLLLLEWEDFDGMEEMEPTFKHYIPRYLVRDYNYRSYCFAKLILLIIKKQFQYEKIEQVGKMYNQKLKETKLQGNMTGMEIIPYETLWKRVLATLKRYEKDKVVNKIEKV